ncbi:MAG: 50S ribosomal protein L4, partial [Saprospiraceae bacterium]
INNPLYPGGGRVFGPKPRDYSQKLNKKVKALARKSALATKAGVGSVIVLEDFSFEAPKTKAFHNILKALQLHDKKTLFVTADYEKEVLLSARNLPKTTMIQAADLNTYQILNANTVVLSESSIEKIKETLA